MQKRRISALPLGLCLGILSVLTSLLFHFFPALCETLYSRGLFVALRWLWGGLSKALPFPIAYLEALLLLALFLGTLRRWFLMGNWKKRLQRLSVGTLNFLGWAVFLFQFAWGFNYQRISTETQTGLELQGLTLEELQAAYGQTLDSAVHFRQQVRDFAFDENKQLPLLHDGLVRALRAHGYPTPGWVFVKPLFGGSLLHFETAGIYLPFAGEGYYDSGLHALSKPFTACHELAHAYGFGDEGICNFWAYVSNSQLRDPLIRYSTELRYLRYLYSAIRRIDPEAYRALVQGMPGELKGDIRAILKKQDAYTSFFPEIRDRVYNSYLKTQGVKEGIRSYSRIVVLVEAWKRQRKKTPPASE